MPFKGCLSDACVLMKIERFVLKPLRKIERFVLKQRTFRFADYTDNISQTRIQQISDYTMSDQFQSGNIPDRYRQRCFSIQL